MVKNKQNKKKMDETCQYLLTYSYNKIFTAIPEKKKKRNEKKKGKYKLYFVINFLLV